MRLQAAGCGSLRAIAAGPEERGIPAAPGRKMVVGPSDAIAGGGQPFRRKRKRRRRVKRYSRVQKAKPLKRLSGFDFAVLGVRCGCVTRPARFLGLWTLTSGPVGRWVLLGCEKPPRGSCKQH
jgi:hypothetical protein